MRKLLSFAFSAGTAAACMPALDADSCKVDDDCLSGVCIAGVCGQPTATTPDATTPDATTLDASPPNPDATTPDASPPNPDATTPDATTLDATTPDATTPNPDAATPNPDATADECMPGTSEQARCGLLVFTWLHVVIGATAATKTAGSRRAAASKASGRRGACACSPLRASPAILSARTAG